MDQQRTSVDNRKQTPNISTPSSDPKIVAPKDQSYDIYLNNNISKCTNAPSAALTIEKNPLNDLHKSIL